MESILLDSLTKANSRQKRGDEYESLCSGETHQQNQQMERKELGK
jgi:hypothetical protein